MYDSWIYHHILNKIWFIGLCFSIFFMGLVYVFYSIWKEQSNKGNKNNEKS